MNRKRMIPIAVLVVAAIAAMLWLRRAPNGAYYTGFVEGEERVLRAEVAGRVLEIAFAEGEAVPPGAVIARLDPGEIVSKIASKQRELEVQGALIRRQQEQVALTDVTWQRDVATREAELRQMQAQSRLAMVTHERQSELAKQGVASPQRLDESRSARDASGSAVDRARDQLARARAMEGEIELARRQLDVMQGQLALARAQLAELEVLHAKYEVRAPATATVVQTQLVWPGELAQPGTPLVSVLDPADKYVQIYVPVADVSRVRVGAKVEIELDSEPGRRVPGEVSFVADQANFTPEKIETRSDRLGQVYRAKVRILEGVERFQPGTEGNVYLVEDDARSASASVPATR
ncbi:MAG: HlyD family efflux transporter periplasmic adaptor subunit [Proteobacteria bacterium]|nr:HlyD family efflux transporter periplasmic adaptor subunit [Pseudomonadota bacterium]